MRKVIFVIASLFIFPPIAFFAVLYFAISYTLKQAKLGAYSGIDFSRINFIAPGFSLNNSQSYYNRPAYYPTKRDAQWYREEQEIGEFLSKHQNVFPLTPEEEEQWEDIVHRLGRS